ncbi:hypothetical protein ARMSODRAFT_1078099 [Armillaria solidipes]|uniref:Uncharacterized protein n=1 Tax=Armillaria solidipes TaxID=1076256 RepID=A0A2H3CB66_9AGAR|nr:hypothetical protein ARMSODRAFT_1078099 [Armillaria solidipes]
MNMNHQVVPPYNCDFALSIDVAATLDLAGSTQAIALRLRAELTEKTNSTLPISGQCNRASPSLTVGNLFTHGRPCAFLSYLKRFIPGRGKLCSCRNHYLGGTDITLPAMTFAPVSQPNDATTLSYHSGLDEDHVLRILDGQEDVPETGNTSETDSQNCHMFFANIPGSEEPEEDRTFMPVLRIDHVLSNVPEISDPSQLWEDRDLFAEIVEEYQLEQYGPVVFDDSPIEDEPLSDNFSVAYSLMSAQSGTSTEELGPDSPDSRELDSSSEESPKAPEPSRKGKWKIKSLFRRAFTNVVEVLKWRKFSNNP